MLILFTFIIMLMATFYNIKIIGVNGIENTDPFAFYKYSFLWLIPTLMVVLSVGMFTTILTNSPVGIIAMLGWWFIAMFGSEANMRGGYGFQLFLRHNILGDTKVYLNNIHIVLLNRGIYITISAILVLISIKIYNKKRKGEIYSGSSKKNNKNEIKHHTYGPIITSFIVYLLIFVLFGLVELKKDIVIMIVERFLPLMGIILISPCFQYEMDYGIEDVIRSKSTGILTTYLIRLILRIFIYGMLTFLFIALIKITDSQVEMALYFFQSFSLGLLLGSLGFCIWY